MVRKLTEPDPRNPPSPSGGFEPIENFDWYDLVDVGRNDVNIIYNDTTRGSIFSVGMPDVRRQPTRRVTGGRRPTVPIDRRNEAAADAAAQAMPCLC